MARRIQDLSDNYMKIIKPDLVELNRTFAEKVDKYLSNPLNEMVMDHGVGAGQVAAVCDDDADDTDENALNGRINELETVYKQQAILMQKLRAELEFYNTVMNVQAEIDDGLCLLIENYMQDSASASELDGAERILEHLNNVLVLEGKNAAIGS